MSKHIRQKLQGIQTSLVCPKGQTNKFGGYSYRSCEDILNSLKPHLKEQGCIVILQDEIVEIANRVYVKSTASLADNDTELAVSSTAYAREAEVKKGMDEAQITGSASSYSRKYALNGLFAIDDSRDPDSSNTHGKQATNNQPSF